MINTVYLGLGSNVGHREEQLQQAIDEIASIEGIDLDQVSTFIETEAVTKMKHPDFINAAISIRTILTPRELLDLFQELERKMGRKSKGNLDPRTLDIDILFYGNDIVLEDDLIIPHPLVHERLFVLTPLAEIAPDFVHPLIGEKIIDLEQNLK